MPYYEDPSAADRDPEFEADLDPEAPSAEDIARFDRDGDACPSCGSEVYDDATICPICGEMLVEESDKPKPWAVIVVGLILLAFVLIYVL